MPTYEHLCHHCNYEWEDIYSMKTDAPTTCPECKTEGQVKRLISGGSGKGIVEITGHDLKDKLKKEGQELKQAAMKDENLLANLVGDSYNTKISRYEKDVANMERPKFTTRKSQR
jgi:putative FmdB family regulatory protein